MQSTDPHLAAGVREGEILAGKYRIERVLGIGGMGAVVAARHLQLDTKVAIKFLLADRLADHEAVARFTREARAAVQITSEHVARVFDVGALDNGAPYMVMEFLEGEDLATWLRQRGPLPIDQAVEFVLQACVAVADAHRLGIVHRDLKPANLFCVRRNDGQFLIKVLDFGISKRTDLQAAEGGGSVTSTNAIMGSPLYMSPEQMRSPKSVDSLTDVWALGVVLFELVTGKVPFTGQTFAEIAVKVATERAPSMRDLRPEVPASLEAAVRKCLEADRRSRYRNVAELASALLPCATTRARTSVERISSILQVPGASGDTSPPFPTTAGTLLAPGTISPVGGTMQGARRRRQGAVMVVLGTLIVLGVVGGLVFMKTNGVAYRDRDTAPTVTTLVAPEAVRVPSVTPPPVPEILATVAQLAPVLPDASAMEHAPAVHPPPQPKEASGKKATAEPPKPAATATATPSAIDADPLSRLKLKP
jgi:serine/threonine protein kinase